MHGSFNRLKYAIGMEEGTEKEFLRAYGALEANPIEPIMVDEASVQEIVKTGDEIDVEELPILTYHEMDSGKFITAALGLMRDPDTGIDNIGIYRHQVHSKNELGVQLSETADGNVIWKKYEERGEPTPMALVIGHHPAFFLGSLSYTPIDSTSFTWQRVFSSARCRWYLARPFRSTSRPMRRSSSNALSARTNAAPRHHSANSPARTDPNA